MARNYHAYKMREARKQRPTPAVTQANNMGASMLDNMYKYVQSGGQSLYSLLRDKGQVVIDPMRTADEKLRDVIRNNTGANLTVDETPLEGLALIARMKRGAAKALTSEPAQRARDFLSEDPVQGMDQTRLVGTTAARWSLPLAGTGLGVMGVASVMDNPGDEQEQGQLTIPGNTQENKENNNAAALAALTVALTGGGAATYGSLNSDLGPTDMTPYDMDTMGLGEQVRPPSGRRRRY